MLMMVHIRKFNLLPPGQINRRTRNIAGTKVLHDWLQKNDRTNGFVSRSLEKIMTAGERSCTRPRSSSFACSGSLKRIEKITQDKAHAQLNSDLAGSR
jgi:hypothetical protein